ncbi:hypothetical protein [Mycolicibacterium tusciae]|nr:hypothetical protein [Mycolicibacterium tusciae]
MTPRRLRRVIFGRPSGGGMNVIGAGTPNALHSMLLPPVNPGRGPLRLGM